MGMRNQTYSHEGMLITLDVRATELDLLADRLHLIRERITPGPDRPDAMYKAEELESDLAALSVEVHAMSVRLDSLREYTMYPPAKYQTVRISEQEASQS